jgi:hypothetical protein
MRAERVVHAVVRALAEEVEIEVGQRGREPIGILDLGHAAVAIGDPEPVAER